MRSSQCTPHPRPSLKLIRTLPIRHLYFPSQCKAALPQISLLLGAALCLHPLLGQVHPEKELHRTTCYFSSLALPSISSSATVSIRNSEIFEKYTSPPCSSPVRLQAAWALCPQNSKSPRFPDYLPHCLSRGQEFPKWAGNTLRIPLVTSVHPLLSLTCQ